MQAHRFSHWLGRPLSRRLAVWVLVTWVLVASMLAGPLSAQSFVVPDIGSRNAALTSVQASGWNQAGRYTVWLERGHLWFSRFDATANAWIDTAVILDVHGATDLQLISGPAPGWGEAYLVAVWLEGLGNEREAYFALGVAKNNGLQVDWTEAQRLTNDAIDDRRIVADYGEPGNFGYLLEKVDSSDSEADADIYFDQVTDLATVAQQAKPLPPAPPDLIPPAPEVQWDPHANARSSRAVFASTDAAPSDSATTEAPTRSAEGGTRGSSNSWPLNTQFGIGRNLTGDDGFGGNEYLEKLTQIKSLANALPKDATFNINARGGGAVAADTHPRAVAMDGKFNVTLKVPLLGGQVSAGDQQITENTSGSLSAMAFFKGLVRADQAFHFPETEKTVDGVSKECLEYHGVSQGLDLGADVGVEAKMAVAKVFSAKVSIESGLMVGLLFSWNLKDHESDSPAIALLGASGSCPTWSDRYKASWRATPQALLLTMLPFTELAGLDYSKYDFEESTKLYWFFKAGASVNLIKILRVKGTVEADVGYVFNPHHHAYEHVAVTASARIAFITITFSWSWDHQEGRAVLAAEPTVSTQVAHDPLNGTPTVYSSGALLTGSGGQSNLLEDEQAALTYLEDMGLWAAAWVEHESTGNAPYPLSRVRGGVFQPAGSSVQWLTNSYVEGSEGLNTGLTLRSRPFDGALAAWSHADTSTLGADSTLAEVQAVAEQTDLNYATLGQIFHGLEWTTPSSHYQPGADGHPVIGRDSTTNEDMVAWINSDGDGMSKILLLRSSEQWGQSLTEITEGFFETTELQLADTGSHAHLSWTEEFDGSYSGEVLFSDPEIYLRFDESSTNEPAHNLGSLGSAANGTYHNWLAYHIQMQKPGALLPGDSDTAIGLGPDQATRIEVPHQPQLSSDSFSVEVWARNTWWGQNRAGIAVKDGEWYLIAPTGYKVRFSAGSALDGSSLGSGEVTADLPDPKQDWHHLVGTYDARSQVAALYIDGELVASKAVRRLGRNSNELVIGGNNAWSGFNQGFGGDLDEFAFYDHPLSAEEIRRHYDARIIEPVKNKVSRGFYSTTPLGSSNWHQPELFEVGLVRPDTHTGDLLETPTTNTDDIDSGYIVNFRDSKTAGRALVAGYFNDDSWGDFAIGDPGEGVVYVAFGGPDLQADLTADKLHRDMASRQNLVIIKGPVGEQFGASLAAADLDGGGCSSRVCDDLVIGAPDGDKVYMLPNGSLTGVVDLTQGTGPATVSPGPAGSQYGFSVAAGDTNGDGFGDVIVGAPADNQGGGTVYRLAGQQNSMPLIWPFLLYQGVTSVLEVTDEPGSNRDVTIRPRVGHAVAIASGTEGWGTFSGDGSADIVIGAPGVVQPTNLRMTNNSGGQLSSSGSNTVVHALKVGAAYVLLGANPNDVLTLTNSAPNPLATGSKEGTHDWAAGTALTVGDFNGDWVDDLAVGAPGYKTSEGVSYILFGGWHRQSGTLDLRTGHDVAIDGVSAMDSSGQALGHADLDKNGLSDVVIASPNAGYSAGQVHVAFGRSGWDRQIDLAPGAVDHTMVLKGGRPHVASGAAVVGTGDVDGNCDSDEDCYPDMVTSAPYAQQVYVVFGHPYLEHGASIDLMKLRDDNGFIIEGSDIRGESLGYVGDVNGDGFTDAMADQVLILGDSTEALLKGATNTAHEYRIPFRGDPEYDPNDFNPPDVSSIGRDDLDLNGDGYSDFVLEAVAKRLDVNLRGNYNHEVIFGGPDPGSLSSVPVSCHYLLGHWCKVISAGDFNGDGYADLAGLVFKGPLLGDRCGGAMGNEDLCDAWIGMVAGGPDLASTDKISIPWRAIALALPAYSPEETYTIDPLGDIDGDGYDDLFVSVRGGQLGKWVLYGQADLRTLARAQPMDSLANGISAAGKLGNLDNGATDEWFVLNDAGLHVFDNTTLVATLSGATRGGASLGDVNGDGLDDFAYGKSSTETRVIYGDPNMTGGGWFDLNSAAGFTIEVPGATSAPLATRLGDMNGDGFDDFGIASSFDQASFVFFGGDFTNRRVLEGTIANDVLRGSGNDQSILTGVGNDYILTSGSGGVYYGGAENDVIALGGNLPRLIDGGWGLDILRPRQTDVWSNGLQDHRIVHMEILDLNHYGAQRIDVDASTFARLLDMSVERQLVIRGDDDDRVVLRDSGLVNHGYVSFQGQSLLKVSKDGVGTLLIEPEIVEFP